MLSGIEEIKVLGAYIFCLCPFVIRVIPNTRDIEPLLTLYMLSLVCVSVGRRNY